MSIILKRGSTGELVRQVQLKLGVSDTGFFGSVTETEVIKYQKANGLLPDGIVGSETLKSLGINTSITEDILLPNLNNTLGLNKLHGHVPNQVINELYSYATKFNITNKLRLTHFLSQCSHESGNFKHLRENLNYSSDGLKRIFPKYFPGTLSESYARNPEKIAARVYGGRMGNGDESTLDGWKFRGRGYLQLTGKNNYTNFSQFIGEDCVGNPDLVATKYPLSSAAYFFNENNLWTICDRGSDESTITTLTRRINGGVNGLAHRISEFKKFNQILK